jgi:dsDNA-binding SOS-regulon protein
MTFKEMLDTAEELATLLTADIPLAKTREEHIRVTARANHATALVNAMRDSEN